MTVDETPQARHWLTVEYENGAATVVAHATQPFGVREAAAHVNIEASEELVAVLDQLLVDSFDEAHEQAADAASEHRTLARHRGEDHRAPLESVGYDEVLPEHGVYSDPRLMAMPVGKRAAALERSVAAVAGEGSDED